MVFLLSLLFVRCFIFASFLYLLDVLMLILEVVYLSRKNLHLLFFNYFILHINDYFCTFAPCLTNLIMFMNHLLEISVDIPTCTAGQFQNKLRQQVKVDGNLEIPFNQLLTSLRFIYGKKAIISFNVLVDGAV